MKFYADSPSRRVAQILGDLVFVAFCVASVWVALQIYDHLMAFAQPSSDIGQSGGELSGSLKDAGAMVLSANISAMGDAAHGPSSSKTRRCRSIVGPGR